VLAGPWATQNLADFGAEVIKIERPGSGDDTRGWGPPFLKDRDGRDTSDSTYFACCNRGKQSVTVNLSHPQGQQLLRKLVAHCDVLVENYKVGDLVRYALDYESLHRLHPGLVYCSITGFGQDGPYADRAGYDYIIQGMSGLMSITGQPDGQPGGAPMRVGVAVVDLFTGLYTCVAILAALHQRERSGEGAHIDMALFDTSLAILANQASNALVSGKDPPRQGNTHPNIVPYQAFDAADQPLIIAVGNDGQFARLAELCGHPEWARDERFATNAARVANRDSLVPLIAKVIRGKSAAEWFAALDAAGIPAGPINTITQAFADVQAQHRQIVRAMGGGALGEVPTVGSPVRMDGERADSDLPPPGLGEHTDEVLAATGLSDADLHKLRRGGVLG
jgi:formyl-CoA transferase